MSPVSPMRPSYCFSMTDRRIAVGTLLLIAACLIVAGWGVNWLLRKWSLTEPDPTLRRTGAAVLVAVVVLLACAFMLLSFGG